MPPYIKTTSEITCIIKFPTDTSWREWEATTTISKCQTPEEVGGGGGEGAPIFLAFIWIVTFYRFSPDRLKKNVRTTI